MDINLLAKNSGNKKQIFLSKKKGKELFYPAKKMELTAFRGGKVPFAVELEQHDSFLLYVYKEINVFPIAVIIALY